MRGKCKTIAINTSFRAAPWADILYACDASWWQHYFTEVSKGFKGDELWTIATAARDQFKLHWVYAATGTSAKFNDDHIDAGKNSGYQALGLARLFGCTRVLLLGYDFQRTNGRGHWHADHPRTLGNGGRFDVWRTEMDQLAKRVAKHGIEVINCTRKTALTCFKKSTIQEELPP